MRFFVFSLWACFCFFCTNAESLSQYWLVEEDFIRLGKTDLYEEEKKDDQDREREYFKKKRKKLEVIGLQDLEKPRYVFFKPLKDLSYLELYPPIKEVRSSLLPTCLYFRIFSLYEYLEECSFREREVFSEQRPYLAYIAYDVFPGSQKSFEVHLEEIALKQKKKSPQAWNCFKVLLGSDVPKYLIYVSFYTKDGLKEASLDDIFKESLIKDIIRNKKSGWVKTQESLSISRK